MNKDDLERLKNGRFDVGDYVYYYSDPQQPGKIINFETTVNGVLIAHVLFIGKKIPTKILPDNLLSFHVFIENKKTELQHYIGLLKELGDLKL
jgi:hypothetical protein